MAISSFLFYYYHCECQPHSDADQREVRRNHGLTCFDFLSVFILLQTNSFLVEEALVSLHIFFFLLLLFNGVTVGFHHNLMLTNHKISLDLQENSEINVNDNIERACFRKMRSKPVNQMLLNGILAMNS